jgi:hypothetical protein
MKKQGFGAKHAKPLFFREPAIEMPWMSGEQPTIRVQILAQTSAGVAFFRRPEAEEIR